MAHAPAPAAAADYNAWIWKALYVGLERRFWLPNPSCIEGLEWWMYVPSIKYTPRDDSGLGDVDNRYRLAGLCRDLDQRRARATVDPKTQNVLAYDIVPFIREVLLAAPPRPGPEICRKMREDYGHIWRQCAVSAFVRMAAAGPIFQGLVAHMRPALASQRWYRRCAIRYVRDAIPTARDAIAALNAAGIRCVLAKDVMYDRIGDAGDHATAAIASASLSPQPWLCFGWDTVRALNELLWDALYSYLRHEYWVDYYEDLETTYVVPAPEAFRQRVWICSAEARDKYIRPLVQYLEISTEPWPQAALSSEVQLMRVYAFQHIMPFLKDCLLLPDDDDEASEDAIRRRLAHIAHAILFRYGAEWQRNFAWALCCKAQDVIKHRASCLTAAIVDLARPVAGSPECIQHVNDMLANFDIIDSDEEWREVMRCLRLPPPDIASYRGSGSGSGSDSG